MYNDKSNCYKGPIKYQYRSSMECSGIHCNLITIVLLLLLVSTYCDAFISSSSSSSSLNVAVPLLKQASNIYYTTYCIPSIILQSKTCKDIDDDDIHEDAHVSHIDVTIQKRINGNKSRRNIIISSSTAVVSSLLLHQSFMMMKSQSSLANAIDSTTTSSTTKTSTKTLKEEYRQGTAALNDMDSMAPVPREAYIKLPSGVIYADVVKPSSNNNNNNNIVKVGSKVNIEWVLRRSNGYFVDSSQVHENRIPFVFTVGEQPNTAIIGLDEGIRGMQVGGVRRLLIPPSLAYVQGVNDGLPGPIPDGYGPRQQIRRIQNIRKDVPGEYIYLEIQLTRLR